MFVAPYMQARLTWYQIETVPVPILDMNDRRIGYEYFCEELFVVKSKHKFSCASAVYFNLNHEIKKKL